jgi:hypothetical protein
MFRRRRPRPRSVAAPTGPSGPRRIVGRTERCETNHPSVSGASVAGRNPREPSVVHGERPRPKLKEMAIMSGCYDYNECDYQQNYDYDYCYRPRHRRHHRRSYDYCWDSNYCS